MANENEKKAREIAHDYFRRGQLGLVAIDTESAGYDCAMRAMRWKDEQLETEKQALIDKACKWWEFEIIYPTMTQAEKDWFKARIEAFKNAMKGE